MPLISKNFTFYHMPKTGGMWVRRRLRWLMKQGHLPRFEPENLSTHAYPEMLAPDRRRGLQWTIVRNPFDWMVSWYRIRARENLLKDIPEILLFGDCDHSSWDAFMADYALKARGRVSEIYGLFTRACEVVCRQESLFSGLSNVLFLSGHGDLRPLIDPKLENETPHVFKMDMPCEWTRAQRCVFWESERLTFQKFGYGNEPSGDVRDWVPAKAST